MDRLSRNSEINGIPYNAYYLSCNLEHVLHNDANINDNLKVEKAEEFSDSFFGRELEFLDFIRTESFLLLPVNMKKLGNLSSREITL